MNEQEINVTSLLMQISSDVAVIKNDMANFKESYKTDNENNAKAMADLREDFNKEVKNLSARVKAVEDEVETLRHKDDTKDANTYRKITAYCLTALGGMAVAKIPDFLAFIISTLKK